MTQKATDPTKRLGVFKRFADVPEEYRLETYRDAYRDTDPWGEFLIQVFLPKHNTYRSKQQARLAGRKWDTLMDDRGRHPALARPSDVDEWCSGLLNQVNEQTAHKTYWSKLEQFYRWLLWHSDHPHTYNPFLMAAANHEAAGEVWNQKMGASH